MELPGLDIATFVKRSIAGRSKRSDHIQKSGAGAPWAGKLYVHKEKSVKEIVSFKRGGRVQESSAGAPCTGK